MEHLESVEILSLYKPVIDWLKMLTLDNTTLNMKDYFLLDINVTERNDLCLNVKGIICSLLEKYF